MIEIRNLTFTYPGAEKATLRDVNLEVEKGDFLAIVGNNGRRGIFWPLWEITAAESPRSAR